LFRYPRGIERYTVNLASALARQEAQVSILTWKWPNPLAWPELDPAVRLRAFPTSRYYTPQFIWPFYLLELLKNPSDMVYIFFADYGEALTFKALKLLRPAQPFSLVLHFPAHQVPHRYQAFMKSGLAAKARHIIAVSQLVADQAQEVFHRPCLVITHGVDSECFKPSEEVRQQVRQELGIAENAPVLLTVSALEERKGIAWMLAAMPGLVKHFPDLAYLVIGNGPQHQELENLVRQSGLEDRVKMLPATSEVVRYYQAADLKIILAHGEASSLVTLEALACQLPVVASLHPPFDELISPEWGLQLDEKDTTGLVAAIQALLHNPERRWRMGVAGRHQVLTRHTWEQVSGQYLELVES
jgi:glycosyltransferase involved in cell wall biosynthesis